MASRHPFRLRPFDIGYLFLVLIVLCALTPTVLSLPVEAGTVQNAASNPTVLVPRQAANVSESYDKDCGFDGDQDMYGLGIRIGYYVQWVATVFGAYFTPKIVSSAFEANAIFNIGMLAGLVFSTIRREDMYVVEPVLVLGFSIGGAIVGLLDPKNFHVANDIHSLQSRLFHLCGTGALSIPLLVYWTWYSFYGMDTLNYNHCSTSTFFIVKINIWAPWFRYFMKVATIMSLIGLFVLAISAVVAYRKKASIPKQEKMRRYSTMFLQRSQSLNRLSQSEEAMTERARPTRMQFFVVIVVCLVCALSVEFGIIWNHITGINALGATGQLIPMAIGVITSIRVFLGVLGQHIKSKKQKRRMAAVARFFGNEEGEKMEILPSRRGSRHTLGLNPSDVEQGKDEVLVLESLVNGAGDGSGKGQFRRSSTTNMTEKPRISPASTSDSHGTITESSLLASNKSVRSVKSVKSVKSNKSGKLTKERREKGKEIEKDDSISVMTLPREPGAVVTRGTLGTPSVITTGSGRKKLHRDSNRKSG